MIPVFKPSITKKEINSVIKVLKSGWLGLGPKTKEFEERFAEYVGAKFAVGLNSGTAALHLALNALEIGKGDEVIVPAITFVSTSHAVLYNNAKPVFADVNENNLCINIKDLERKITKRTKAIIPVHYGGHPCEMDAIQKIAEKRGIYIIEDAAHACGAEYKGKKIGSISKISCFSFHAVKNLTCGEGGMITTDDKEIYDKLIRIRWLGISKDTWSRSVKAKIYAWQYWVTDLGFKSHLSDLAAAIGIAQLSRLDKLNEKRRQLVSAYNKGLSNLEGIILPKEGPGVKSSWHIYHIKTSLRDELMAHLKACGIAPGVHYYPIHLHPYYSSYKSKCPVAEEVWKKIITLPLFPDMKHTQISSVIKAVKNFSRSSNWNEARLEGKKTILRNVGSSDLEKMMVWRNRFRKYFFNMEMLTKEKQSEWFERYLKDKSDKMFIIETKKGLPIGMIGLKSKNPNDDAMELGRVVIGEREFRHRGYASEAIRSLLKFSFGALRLKRVYLKVFEKNLNAINLYKSCGFRKMPDRTREIKIGPHFKKINMMQITDAEFRQK